MHEAHFKPDSATVQLWLEIIRRSLCFALCFKKKKKNGFDAVFFGNSQQAFIAALKPRTCCISETQDPNKRVGLLSGNYLKGLIFWKHDSFFYVFFFFKKKKYRQISASAVPWKYPYSSLYAGWSMTPPTSHLSATLTGVNPDAGSDQSFRSLQKTQQPWTETPTRSQACCMWRWHPTWVVQPHGCA